MSYFGGKGGSGVYQTIINQQPPHRVYVEPFLGMGSVLRNKRPAEITIGIDSDPAVIARWAGAAASPDLAMLPALIVGTSVVQSQTVS